MPLTDLARLRLVRQQRDEAAGKRDAEKDAKEAEARKLVEEAKARQLAAAEAGAGRSRTQRKKRG